jgi:hypothetical protein
MPREDFRLKPVRLRVRTRSRRGGGVGLRLGAGGGRGLRVYGVRDVVRLRVGRRIYHGGIVLSFLLRRRGWSNGFGFLLARSEKHGAGQNAD